MKSQVSAVEIARMIDHSLLHPMLTEQELKTGYELARKFNVASVCVKPHHTKLAKEYLEGSDVLVGAVIGFPHGNSTLEIKVLETEQVVSDGAAEVDMVVNISKVLEENWDYLEKEIGAVKEVTGKNNVVLKIIFENDFLNEDKHKIKLCENIQ